MKQIALVTLFLLTACSMEQRHTGAVEFRITVDSAVMNKYFGAKCAKELPSASQEEMQACIDLSVGEFLDAIGMLANPPAPEL